MTITVTVHTVYEFLSEAQLQEYADSLTQRGIHRVIIDRLLQVGAATIGPARGPDGQTAVTTYRIERSQ